VKASISTACATLRSVSSALESSVTLLVPVVGLEAAAATELIGKTIVVGPRGVDPFQRALSKREKLLLMYNRQTNSGSVGAYGSLVES
jgi:hypothetical protein